MVRIKNMKKSSLDIVGLPNYCVEFGTYPHEAFSVFLFRNDKREKKVVIGESIKCEDSQGKGVTITFYDKPLIAQPEKDVSTREKAERKAEDPDFFKKREERIINFGSDEYKGDIK